MSTRPEVYTALERTMRLFDLDEGNRWIAAKLQGVAHPAAKEAVTLLRAGEREAARLLVARTLHAMAGASDGSGLRWWQPPKLQDRSGVPEPKEPRWSV